jgi:hypothetical protein
MSAIRCTERLLDDTLSKFVSAEVSIARLVHEGNKIWKNRGQDNTMPTTFYLRQEISNALVNLSSALDRIQEFEHNSTRQQRRRKRR